MYRYFKGHRSYFGDQSDTVTLKQQNQSVLIFGQLKKTSHPTHTHTFHKCNKLYVIGSAIFSITI